MESRSSIDLDLSQYLLLLKRRWLPAVALFIFTVISAAWSTLFLNPSYEAQGKLLFKIDRTAFLTGLGEEIDQLRPLVDAQNPLSTEVEVIYSHPLLQQIIDQLNLTNNEGLPLEPEALKRRLTIKIVGGTDVVRLSYKGNNSEKGAAVINQLMRLYIENQILSKKSEAAKAREFITNQLPQSEANVRQAEAALRQFKERNQVVSLTEEARSLVAVMADLDSKITTVQAQLEEANAQAAGLRSQVGLNPQQAIAISALSQSTSVQGVLQELQEVERQLAVGRNRYGKNHPVMIRLTKQQRSLRGHLQQQIDQILGSQSLAGTQIQITQGVLEVDELKQKLINDFIESEVKRQSLAEGLATLANARIAYEQRVNVLPRLEQTQQQLEQRLQAARLTYETLLKNLNELKVAENQDTANARIIEPAIVPKKPLGDKKLKVLALGVMLGVTLATTAVLLLEMRDRSIKTLKEVKQLLRYPVLGVIPVFKHKNLSRRRDDLLFGGELPVRDQPHSMVSEVYRMIQANLKFLKSDHPPKVIVVTSSVSKEGKSTVSANLATAMAQLGRRVLLIDSDMRHPSQHYIWQVMNVAGLSQVLIGEVPLELAICQAMENLDLLTAGVMPPNPLALLDSKQMASLIQEFSTKYDFVIIDAPPLLLTADALCLSPMTDGMLLVARPGVLDFANANVAKQMLDSSGQTVLGLVANGVIQKDESIGYFYQSQEYFHNGSVRRLAERQAQTEKNWNLSRR